MAAAPKKVEILIVEDVEPMRKLLEHVIGQAGAFSLSGSARSSVEARVEMSRRRPDVVLLDEVLPGESSVDFLQDLVKQGIRVVLLTSLEEPDHPVPPGALGRIQKPTLEAIEEDQARVERELAELLSS